MKEDETRGQLRGIPGSDIPLFFNFPAISQLPSLGKPFRKLFFKCVYPVSLSWSSLALTPASGWTFKASVLFNPSLLPLMQGECYIIFKSVSYIRYTCLSLCHVYQGRTLLEHTGQLLHKTDLKREIWRKNVWQYDRKDSIMPHSSLDG